MAMAHLMPPPQLSGFSLRVQLFAHTVQTTSDRPLLQFRVVTRSDATIREFCEEASRIYEDAYSKPPLRIKKCQDDQEFDIMQDEVVGNLFTNMAVVRIIQAAASPNIRDSVPPNSALRYDPSNPLRKSTLKRAREESVSRNLSNPSPSGSFKRQKIVDLDPDHPIPSREVAVQHGETTRPVMGKISPIDNVVPNSQESVDLGDANGCYTTPRNVRNSNQEVPATPTPSPPPESLAVSSSQNTSADHKSRKSVMPKTSNGSNSKSSRRHGTPKAEAPARARSIVSNSARAKSATYHIERATERGSSVSTAATSPLSEQVAAANGTSNGMVTNGNSKTSFGSAPNVAINPANKFASNPIKPKQKSRSVDEDSIYDNVPSDNEGDAAAILSLKKARLKIRQSPNAGLPGLKFANHKSNTPPSVPRRTSRSQGHAVAKSPGEVPLTPSSKARNEEEKRKAEATRTARASAAQAAEQRRRDAEEKRAVGEARVAEEERAKKEELERLEIEDFKKGEAIRAIAIAKAERLRNEREEREKRETQEQKQMEEEKRQAAEKRNEEERVSKAKAESERLEQENIRAQEAKRIREQDEERTRREISAAAKKAREKSLSHEMVSPTHEPKPRGKRSISNTPGPIRPQSSTPFIPSGRKSALKSHSSQAPSSPSVQATSPEATAIEAMIESQIPVPKPKNRRISFAEDTNFTRKVTPIKPPTSILRQRTGGPPPSTPSSTPKTNPQIAKIASQAKRSQSPILPPNSRVSKPRSITPVTLPKTAPAAAKNPSSTVEAKAPQASRAMPLPPKKTTTPSQALPREKSASKDPPAKPIKNVEIASQSKSESKYELESESEAEAESEKEMEIMAPVKADSQRETSAYVKPTVKKSVEDEVVASSDDSEEDIPAAVTPQKQAARAARNKVESQPESESEDDQKGERASNPSSTRDSRSPIIFSQHPQHTQARKVKSFETAESDSSEDGNDESGDDEMADASAQADESQSDSESNEGDNSDEEMIDAPAEVSFTHSAEADGSESDSDDEAEEQERIPQSSPQLPRHKHQMKKSELPYPDQRKDNSDKDSADTQGELAQQLTSSMIEARPTSVSSSIKYPPSTSIRYPSSSVTLPSQRPSMKFGASLSQLAAKKPMMASSTGNGITRARVGRSNLQAASESESSDEESNDDSSEDEGKLPASRKATAPPPKSDAKAVESDTSTSGSGSSDDSSDSDRDSDSGGSETRMRNNLAAQIANMSKGFQNSQTSNPSSQTVKLPLLSTQPKLSRPLTKKQDPGYGKTAPKKDKYISGYTFSQPK